MPIPDPTSHPTLAPKIILPGLQTKSYWLCGMGCGSGVVGPHDSEAGVANWAQLILILGEITTSAGLTLSHTHSCASRQSIASVPTTASSSPCLPSMKDSPAGTRGIWEGDLGGMRHPVVVEQARQGQRLTQKVTPTLGRRLTLCSTTFWGTSKRMLQLPGGFQLSLLGSKGLPATNITEFTWGA